ncbi:MAG TPA: hypothetical protein VEB87_07610 [Nitrososphaerales archaeon]|nr:hypothetical protein [Nitrososphaerales archaeon]
MPDFRAEVSSTGSRDSVPGSDVDAPGGSGRLNVRLLLAVVAIALAVKFTVFGLSIGTSMGLSIPNAENWQDFSLAYMPAATALRSGFLPYSDFFYAYPPLFLYAQAAFSFLPLPSWSGAIPLVAADALTVVPVYLIAGRLWRDRKSLLVSVLFILGPTNLYYVDYLWLNPPLTTLFLMVSVYFLIEKRYDLSALILAISIGFKQTALFALPIFFLVVWRGQRGRSGALRYLLIVASVCVLFSLPYLLTSPGAYLASIFRVPPDLWDSRLPPNYFQIGVGTGTPVSFNTLDWLTSKWALLSAGVYSPATLALPVFIFLVPSTYSWIYSSSSALVLAGYLVITVCFGLLLRGVWKRTSIDQKDILRYVLCAMLLVFTFYPLYKYYVVGVVPFLALMARRRRDAVGFIAFSLALMLVPRYFASWALLITLVWLLRRDAKLQPVWFLRSLLRRSDRSGTGVPDAA